MATLKRRLHRNNGAGYDTVHFETESSLVLRPSGRTVEQDLADYLPEVQASDSVPNTLKGGHIKVCKDRIYVGAYNGTVMEVVTMAHELNIGTFNGMTADQLFTLMKQKGIGETEAGSITDYSDIITGQIALGATVTMGGHQWVVCHIDYNGKIFYLLDAIVEENVTFGSNTNYPGSNLAAKAKAFENSLPSAVRNKLLTCNISGVSAKVFVPTHAQYNGGFNLFTNASTDTNRIGYLNGAAVIVWTSSPSSSSYVWYVYSDGNLNYYGPSNACGFRPCVALKL